jgi:hypothetical protein
MFRLCRGSPVLSLVYSRPRHPHLYKNVKVGQHVENRGQMFGFWKNWLVPELSTKNRLRVGRPPSDWLV